ncbi:MAG: AI-2E family transporter [Flammeovirgaceae bacterium]|nr:AI-2E family transporter [Flammeovirgaceae bacterium]
MEKDIRTIKSILIIFVFCLVIYLIFILAEMLIPLALAIFIAILLQPVLAWLDSKKFPFGLSMILITFLTVGIIYLVGVLVVGTWNELSKEQDELLQNINERLNSLLGWINSFTDLQLSADEFIITIKNLISADWLIKSTGNFAGALGDFTTIFFMTILYLVVLLGGILKYEKYISYLEEDIEEEGKLLNGFEKVKSSVSTYIKVKFFTSLLTGISYWLVCWIFQIEFAIFWGFLAFILNFIPTVGSIIATIPPIMLGLIEFESLTTLLIFMPILFSVQMIFGNVIEPKLMGSRLSLNTITVILGLVFWGYLWGITGMILSVPLMVLLKVILEQVNGAQVLVKLMGSKNLS